MEQIARDTRKNISSVNAQRLWKTPMILRRSAPASLNSTSIVTLCFEAQKLSLMTLLVVEFGFKVLTRKIMNCIQRLFYSTFIQAIVFLSICWDAFTWVYSLSRLWLIGLVTRGVRSSFSNKGFSRFNVCLLMILANPRVRNLLALFASVALIMWAIPNGSWFAHLVIVDIV